MWTRDPELLEDSWYVAIGHAGEGENDHMEGTGINSMMNRLIMSDTWITLLEIKASD